MENYFDERLYLKNDKAALAHIDLLQKRYSFLLTFESWRFEELLKLYNHYLRILSDFINELDLNNSIEYSIALSYLIKNGYLSLNKDFKDKETKEEVHIRFGTSILNGYAVCRNYSDMNKDILMLLDMCVKTLYCYFNPSLTNIPINKEANHVVNLIEYDGVKYAIDLFNDCSLYHFKNPFILERISKDNVYKMRYKPYYDMIMGDDTLEDVKRSIYEYDIESKKDVISAYDYEHGIKDRVLAYMEKHRDLFEDFHRETNDDKEYMVRLLTIDK